MIRDIREEHEKSANQIDLENIITDRQNSYYRGVLTAPELQYADRWNISNILWEISQTKHGRKLNQSSSNQISVNTEMLNSV